MRKGGTVYAYTTRSGADGGGTVYAWISRQEHRLIHCATHGRRFGCLRSHRGRLLDTCVGDGSKIGPRSPSSIRNPSYTAITLFSAATNFFLKLR